jgi:hypothetical protein
MPYETICVPRLRFQEIHKEWGTRGNLYVVWCSFREAFVAQTLPPLISVVSKLTNLKIHVSSFYRILRLEARKQISKGIRVKQLSSLQELNEFLEGFELLIVCTQDLHKWVVDPDSVQEEKDGNQSP